MDKDQGLPSGILSQTILVLPAMILKLELNVYSDVFKILFNKTDVTFIILLTLFYFSLCYLLKSFKVVIVEKVKGTNLVQFR